MEPFSVMVNVGLAPKPAPVCVALVRDVEYDMELVEDTSVVPPPVIVAADEVFLVH